MLNYSEMGINSHCLSNHQLNTYNMYADMERANRTVDKKDKSNGGDVQVVSNSCFNGSLVVAMVVCTVMSLFLISDLNLPKSQMSSVDIGKEIQPVYTNNQLWQMQVNYIDYILQDNGMYLHDTISEKMLEPKKDRITQMRTIVQLSSIMQNLKNLSKQIACHNSGFDPVVEDILVMKNDGQDLDP